MDTFYILEGLRLTSIFYKTCFGKLEYLDTRFGLWERSSFSTIQKIVDMEPKSTIIYEGNEEGFNKYRMGLEMLK